MKRASRKVGTIEPNEARSCGPGKGRALYPQVWPQSQLSLTYIRKAVPYDNLSLAEFAARFACILRLPSLSATQRDAHTEHFTTLMYLATQVSWPAICSLHAAVLFEIECGHLRCFHSFAHLEARLLHGQANQSRSTSAPVTKPPATIQFCKAFQTGSCSSNKDHYGFIRNERKWVQHICAKCWLTKQEVQGHPENSNVSFCQFMEHRFAPSVDNLRYFK